MPTRIDRDWNIVLPKGESFGFVLRNYGTAKTDENFRAVLAVQDKFGQFVLRKETVPDVDGVFRFNLAPEDTMELAEGVYLYDIVIEKMPQLGEMSEQAAQVLPEYRYTMFAPEMRRFIVGRVADDGV